MSPCRQESTDSTCVLTLHVFILVSGTAIVQGNITVESYSMKISKVIVNASFLVHFGSPNSDTFVGLRAMRNNHSGVDNDLSYPVSHLHQLPIAVSAK